jgi:hypothetical protein
MPWSRYVLGFHGCDEVTAGKVAAGLEGLKPSRNDYDWLGHGLYFWEDGCERALRWAKEQSRRSDSPIKSPAVLGAVIDLGNCLDLVQVEYLDLVKDAHQHLVELFEEIDRTPPANSGPGMRSRKLDCAVFESLHQFRTREKKSAFDCVRAFFTEGEPLYPNAGIRHLDHVQICVRDPRSIVGYFLPRR